MGELFFTRDRLEPCNFQIWRDGHLKGGPEIQSQTLKCARLLLGHLNGGSPCQFEYVCVYFSSFPLDH